MINQTDKFVFVCAGLRAGDKVPCVNALFFTDEEEAKPEMKYCTSSFWSILYKGYDFKEAAKALNNIESQGYLANHKEREILNSYL